MICLRGAKIEDVTEYVKTVSNTEQVCIVHVGTNNVGRYGVTDFYKEMCGKYTRLLMECSKKDRVKFIISGIVPRADFYPFMNGVDPLVFQQIGLINSWLEGECKEWGFGFVSLHREVAWVWKLLSRDGLHLNRAGAAKLGRVFHDQVSMVQGSLN